ncbi:hypothetical protein DEIPH_ctg013orf0008 [Deinococcus phoenicis]|uniref:Uncharacterized protein n=1 Tax=Deinococcus phoenicis TaxID=1476583 RepID=A0A016QSD5_9DEIO|nr:hypothetical protein [Deinococcus phoenicis]EYB68906.1 hypothetical protein DEIPH_ctg013orf0008 [Deinococcus phoenicis]
MKRVCPTYVQSLAARRWDAFAAELAEEPYTAERARLEARTRRLVVLLRAAEARVERCGCGQMRAVSV